MRICGGRRVRFPPATRRNERVLHRRPSESRWPRAMRWRPARAQRSVGQGCAQAGLLSLEMIWSGVPTLSMDRRKATSPAAFSRVVGGPRGVGEPVHARDLFMRRTGRSHGHPPVVIPAGAGRAGKAEAVIPRWTIVRSRTVSYYLRSRRTTPKAGRRRRWREGTGQGEHGQQNTPRTQCRARRAQVSLVACAEWQQGQGSAVHRAPAPRRRRPPAGGLLGVEPEGRAGGGRGDVA